MTSHFDRNARFFVGGWVSERSSNRVVVDAPDFSVSPRAIRVRVGENVALRIMD